MIEICGKRKIYSATMVVRLKVFFFFFFFEGVVDIKTVKIGV